MKSHEYFIEKIIKLLQDNASTQEAYGVLADKIAKKSVLMNHLYEDLELNSREEMSLLMSHHFSPLAMIKPPHIRWKKFLFDSIGEIAPACQFCYDQTNCFGCELQITKGEKDEFNQNCTTSV